MIRDRSTLALGVVLPMVLLLLFGYGVSLDVENIPVTVVRDSESLEIRDLYTKLKLSRYFDPSMADSMKEAEELLKKEKTDAIVRVNSADVTSSGGAFQIIVNGRDSNKARTSQRYLEGAIAQWAQSKITMSTESQGQVVAEPRIWYNHSMESRYFLVPGVIVLIMTLIGALLTALVVAREWERGTYEVLIATPVTPGEFLIGKIVPYFLLGMTGLCLCLCAAVWIFEVPMRGGLLAVVLGSSLYLLVALGIGLLVSSVTKSQFLASQFVLIICFLPTLMLSGFIFDLNSAPLFVYYLAHVFPATWYVDLMQTLFLVGEVPSVIGRDFCILGGIAVILLLLVRMNNHKSLE